MAGCPLQGFLKEEVPLAFFRPTPTPAHWQAGGSRSGKVGKPPGKGFPFPSHLTITPRTCSLTPSVSVCYLPAGQERPGVR